MGGLLTSLPMGGAILDDGFKLQVRGERRVRDRAGERGRTTPRKLDRDLTARPAKRGAANDFIEVAVEAPQSIERVHGSSLKRDGLAARISEQRQIKRNVQCGRLSAEGFEETWVEGKVAGEHQFVGIVPAMQIQPRVQVQ